MTRDEKMMLLDVAANDRGYASIRGVGNRAQSRNFKGAVYYLLWDEDMTKEGWYRFKSGRIVKFEDALASKAVYQESET